MPSTSAIDSEMKSILVVRFLPYFRPGSKSLSPAAELSAADWNSAEKLKPNWPRTMSVMTAVPAMSSSALMICTQVVPFIPPMST